MKKGQLQIQETMFVLIVVVVMLIVGMMFFFNFQKKDVENMYYEYQEDKFQEMILTVPNLPELKCSRLTRTEECIDLYKASGFSQVSSQSSLYRGELGFREIILKLEGEEIVIYKREKPNFEDVRVIRSPVSVYDPSDSKYKIGVLEIRWFR